MRDAKPAWKKVVERKHPPLFMDFLLRGQDESVFKRATGLSFALTNVRKVKLGLYVDSNEMQTLMRVMNDHYDAKGAAFFGDYANRCYKACHELLKTAEQLGREQHARLLNEELAEGFKSYDKRVLAVAAFLESIIAAQWVLERLFDDSLTDFLSRRNKLEQKDRLKSSLAVPTEDNFIVQSIRDLNRLAADIQNSPRLNKLFQLPTDEVVNSLDQVPEITQAIDRYISNFGWMKPLYYSGRPAMRADIVGRIQKALQTDCREKLAISTREQAESSSRLDEALRVISEDRRLVELVDIVREFLHLRTYRLDVFFIANNGVLSFTDEIARRIGIDYEDLLFLTVDEILSALRGEESSAKAVASERQQGFAVSMENGTIKWYSGSSLAQYLSSEWEKAQPTNELRGVVASPGRVMGTAKILLDNADMRKMMDGDILVTTMTTPNFMEAIEKAAGLVTSEGGMLCHAAIVSRELGLPCVIGTERATEIFADYDSLEVIAEGSEGIVRRL